MAMVTDSNDNGWLSSLWMIEHNEKQKSTLSAMVTTAYYELNNRQQSSKRRTAHHRGQEKEEKHAGIDLPAFKCCHLIL
jgi:hypothetical protein